MSGVAGWAARSATKHHAELLTASWSPLTYLATAEVMPQSVAIAAATVAAAASVRSFASGEYHQARRMRNRIGKACMQHKLLCQLPDSPGGELRPPRMTLPRRTRSGWEVYVRVPDHSADVAFEQLLGMLESNLTAQITITASAGPRSRRHRAAAAVRGAKPKRRPTGVVARARDPRRVPKGWLHLRIRLVDVLAGVDPYWPELDVLGAAGVGALDLYDGFNVGVDEDANRATLTLPQRNLLIGGLMGMGKSTFLHLVSAAAALDPMADLFLIDPSGGVELGLWSDVAEQTAETAEEAAGLLVALRERGDRMLADLKASGRRNVSRHDRRTVIVVDELQSLTAHPDAEVRKAVGATLMDIVGRFRKIGYIVIMATLRPTSDVVPTSLRDLIAYRIAFRCATKTASDVILGDNWAARGFDAADVGLFPDDLPGAGLLYANGKPPRRIKTPNLSAASIERIHDHALAMRGGPAEIEPPVPVSLGKPEPAVPSMAAVDPNARRLAAASGRASKRRRRPGQAERARLRAIEAQDARADGGWTPPAGGAGS